MDVDANAVPDKNKVEPLSPMSPFSPLSPKTPPLEGEPAPQPKGKREGKCLQMTAAVVFFLCSTNIQIFKSKSLILLIRIVLLLM